MKNPTILMLLLSLVFSVNSFADRVPEHMYPIDDTVFAAFEIGSYGNQSVDENNTYTSPAPTITGNPAGAITYSLEGPDTSQFSIDPVTGIVTMEPRDYEIPTDADFNNLYSVNVVGVDEDNTTVRRELDVVVFNDCSVNDVSENIKLTAPDALGDVNGNTVTLRVTIIDNTQVPQEDVVVGFTLTSGTASPAATTATTNASGVAEITVSSSTVGSVVYEATYDTDDDNNPDTAVPLGSPIAVRFANDIGDFTTGGMVGVGTNNPDGSTVLEVAGTDKGVLIPRVSLTSNTDTSTIPSPAVSLLVYNLNGSATALDEGFVFWTGALWKNICEE
jgi:hypothetical protein